MKELSSNEMRSLRGGLVEIEGMTQGAFQTNSSDVSQGSIGDCYFN